MSKFSYIIFILIIIALSIFIFYPSDNDGNDMVRIFLEDTPKSFSISNYNGVQKVSKNVSFSLSEYKFTRELDGKNIKQFFKKLKKTKVNQNKIRKSVNSKMIASFGITGEYYLKSNSIFWQWGSVDGSHYIYDANSQTIFNCKKSLTSYLNSIRFDQKKIINAEITTVVIGKKTYYKNKNRWIDKDLMERPSLNSRLSFIQRLFAKNLTLRKTEKITPSLLAIRMILIDKNNKSYSVVCDKDALFIDGLIPQKNNAYYAALRELVDDLDKDYLLDIEDFQGDNPINKFKVINNKNSINNISEFTLMRNGDYDEEHEKSKWECSYKNKNDTERVIANSHSASIMRKALNNIVIKNWKKKKEKKHGLNNPYCVISIRDDAYKISISEEKIETDYYKADIVELPELLKNCNINYFLNKYLLNVDYERITKFQRINHEQNSKGECFLKINKEWVQTYPTKQNKQIRQVVCKKIIHLLSKMKAIETSIDKLPKKPLYSFAIKIEPLDIDDAEALNMEDTFQRAVEFIVYKSGNNYEAFNSENLLSYKITKQDIDILITPMQQKIAFPIINSLIFEIKSKKFNLVLENNQWFIFDSNKKIKAENIQVNRYLDFISKAEFIKEAKNNIPPTDIDFEFSLSMPGEYEETDTINITLGKEKNNEIEVFVSKDKEYSKGIILGKYIITKENAENIKKEKLFFLP